MKIAAKKNLSLWEMLSNIPALMKINKKSGEL